MFDSATLAALASSTVTVIKSLLQKSAEKGADKIGESAATGLLAKLKERLKRGDAKEAIDDLANAPADPAAQGALNMRMRKALAADPDLVAFLKRWLEESSSAVGSSQTANVLGNDNKVTQIVGSGNRVG